MWALVAGLWLGLAGLAVASDTGADSGVFRVSEKIYTSLPHQSHCFRLFNATHEVGCQSERYGDVGSVALVRSEADVAVLEADATGLAPYVALVDFKILATKAPGLQDALRRAKKVAGVMVLFPDAYKNETDLPGFSADGGCPSSTLEGYPGCGPGQKWNPSGEEFWLRAWRKPIFLLHNQTEIDIISITCFNNINLVTQGYPRCGVRLKFWMFGAVSTSTCLRRNDLFDGLNTGAGSFKTCAPMSDFSVFAQVPGTNASVESERPGNGSVLLLTARLDSFAAFTDQTPGFQSSLLGVTALLAAAEALGRDQELFRELKEAGRSSGKSLLFAFLNGEALDFVGSQKLVFDLQRRTFPVPPSSQPDEEPHTLGLESVGMVVEVGQVGHAHKAAFAHLNTDAQPSKVLDDVLASLRKGFGGDVKEVRHPEGVFPPASLSTFRREAPALPSLLVADFEDRFLNRYYNSFVDTGARLRGQRSDVIDGVVSVADGLLQAAKDWLGASGASVEALKVNRSVVEAWYGCFERDESWFYCDTTANAVPEYYLRNGEQAYSKINKTGDRAGDRTYMTPEGGGSSSIRLVVNGSLSFYLADRDSGLNQSECRDSLDQSRVHRWLRRPEGPRNGTETCCVSAVYVRQATSPAFELGEAESGKFSTWAESTWGKPSLEVFLMPSPVYEGLTLGLGLFVLLLSFALAFFVDRKSQVLFPPAPVPL